MTPSGHTLNGYMYTLLGVYDWSRVSVDRGNDARAISIVELTC